MATVITHVISSTPNTFIASGPDQHEGLNSTSTPSHSGPPTDNPADQDIPESERLDDNSAASEDPDDDADEYLGDAPQDSYEPEIGADELHVQDAHENHEQLIDDEEHKNEDVEEPIVRHPNRRPNGQFGKKKKPAHRRVSDEQDDSPTSDSSDVDSSDDSSDDSLSENAGWDAEGDAEEADEIETAEGNTCYFCKQLEDDDPSEEFELILICISCGENAHRQCAREANSFNSEEDADSWRCPSCVDAEVTPELTEMHKIRRRSSAPKIARDLLPAQRAVKAGSHSVFNTLILDDDPMDGSRSLRKRKTSTEVDVRIESGKRLRTSSIEAVTASPIAQTVLQESGSAVNVQDPEPAVKSQPISHAVAETPRSRSSRLRQQKRPERPHVTVLENSEHRYLLSISIKPALMYRLVDEARKRKRRARDTANRQKKLQELEQTPMVEVSHYPAIQSASFTASFVALQDREGAEAKSKPYGGILAEAEADNSRTFPQPVDRKKFENARLKAEDDWREKITKAAAEQARISQKASGPLTRIKCIQFGGFEIDTWHSAPYPEEYSRNRVLYICEFCLKYMNSDFVAWRHKLKCPARHPPGDEIYHDGTFSFFEVDGRKNPVYCQNLCLLAKLFLGSKTLYYDVEPFLFYVMTENNEEGCHFVGYFSKEKRPSSQNNVSCILVLPIHQRRGFGQMLIEFSYLLTRVENKTGSPEKPLSDMGLVSYRSYWRRVLCEQLANQKAALSINDISDRTGMTADDIVCGLEGLRAMVRDPVTKTYGMRLDHAFFRQYLENYEKKGHVKINPDALTWVPYVMGRDNSHYETTHIQTVAQRGDDTSSQSPRMPEEGVQLTMNGLSGKLFGGSKSGDSVIGTSTHGEEADLQDQDGQVTPFPSFESNSSRQGSPSKRSRTATTNGPSTPQAEAAEAPETPIPPTRFEVFPPLPGSTSRKKSSKPWSRPTGRRTTPYRRGSPPLKTPDTATTAVPSMLRNRSKLADMMNGPDDDEDDGDQLQGEQTEAFTSKDVNITEGEDGGGAKDDLEMAIEA